VTIASLARPFLPVLKATAVTGERDAARGGLEEHGAEGLLEGGRISFLGDRRDRLWNLPRAPIGLKSLVSFK